MLVWDVVWHISRQYIRQTQCIGAISYNNNTKLLIIVQKSGLIFSAVISLHQYIIFINWEDCAYTSFLTSLTSPEIGGKVVKLVNKSLPQILTSPFNLSFTFLIIYIQLGYNKDDNIFFHLNDFLDYDNTCLAFASIFYFVQASLC